MKCKLVLILILLAASSVSSLWAVEQRGFGKFADEGVPGVSATAAFGTYCPVMEEIYGGVLLSAY